MWSQAAAALRWTCSAMSHSPGTPAHTLRKKISMSESHALQFSYYLLPRDICPVLEAAASIAFLQVLVVYLL